MATHVRQGGYGPIEIDITYRRKLKDNDNVKTYPTQSNSGLKEVPRSDI